MELGLGTMRGVSLLREAGTDVVVYAMATYSCGWRREKIHELPIFLGKCIRGVCAAMVCRKTDGENSGGG